MKLFIGPKLQEAPGSLQISFDNSIMLALSDKAKENMFVIDNIQKYVSQQ